MAAKHLIEADGETHSPNCFPCKLKSIQFAPNAMPSRSPGVAETKVAEKALEVDRDAYKGLRRNGEQPKAIKGSAKLAATANESFEIKMARVESDPLTRARYVQAFDEMPAPSTTPIVREDA